MLVVGGACSGTEWVGGTLARIADLTYVHEPDNPMLEPFAVHARVGLGTFPAIGIGDRAPELYTRLWDVAFGRRTRWAPTGPARRLWRRVDVAEKLAEIDPVADDTDGAGAGERDDDDEPSRRCRLALRYAQPMPRGRARSRRIVSSVDLPLALRWVTHRYGPDVVFVRRHPLEVVASRLHEGPPRHGGDAVIDAGSVEERIDRWRIPRPPLAGHTFARLVWTVGFEMSAYQEVADTEPGCQVVDYRLLCTRPDFELRRLLAGLDLVWKTGDEVGSGPPPAAPDAPAALSPEQVALAQRLLALFPIGRHFHDLHPPSAASNR